TAKTVAAPGVLGNDTDVDSGDSLSVYKVNGSTASVGSQIVLASGALLTLNGNGSFTYDPNGKYESLAAGQQTTDSFTYVAQDNHGGVSSAATVTVTITGVNDNPVAVSDATSTDENTAKTVAAPGVLGNDTDVDSGDSLSVYKVNGSTASVGSQIVLASGALLTLNGNDSFTQHSFPTRRSSDLGQQTTDSFTYVAQDNHGGVSSAATVTVTI